MTIKKIMNMSSILSLLLFLKINKFQNVLQINTGESKYQSSEISIFFLADERIESIA